jgi:putative Mn2+ efflux pump MntP
MPRRIGDDRRMLALMAFVLPLGFDSFAVSAALGARRPTRAQRWRISGLFVLFEAGMPLVGLAVGAPMARVVGPAAEYVAAAVLIAVGLWMIRSDDDDDDRTADRLLSARGWTAIGLGLSISLDELAIGVTLGLAHLPVPAVIVAIAVQTLIVCQLGLLLGTRVGAIWRERAERLAGVMLALLGVGLIVVALVR